MKSKIPKGWREITGRTRILDDDAWQDADGQMVPAFSAATLGLTVSQAQARDYRGFKLYRRIKRKARK